MAKDKNENPEAVFIITGLSGAGKSTALRVFEDLRFFTVDGLPASLTAEMVSMMKRQSMSHFNGIALGMDIRQVNFLDEINGAFEELTSKKIPFNLLFLHADSQVLLRRYAATRRPHPLENENVGLAAALEREKALLQPLKEMADRVIDTSGLSIHDLRRIIQDHCNKKAGSAKPIRVNIISFGFKYGVPREADMVFDVRFLPNPYFVAELRPLCGLDKAVSDYVLSFPTAVEFRQRLASLMLFIIPAMKAEGRYRVTVAIGCTGGKHRSVTIAKELAAILRQADFPTMLEHRHLELG